LPWLDEWSAIWQIDFNKSKFYVTHITKRKTADHLGIVHHQSYLGMELSDDLRWNNYITVTQLTAKSC